MSERRPETKNVASSTNKLRSNKPLNVKMNVSGQDWDNSEQFSLITRHILVIQLSPTSSYKPQRVIQNGTIYRTEPITPEAVNIFQNQEIQRMSVSKEGSPVNIVRDGPQFTVRMDLSPRRLRNKLNLHKQKAAKTKPTLSSDLCQTDK